MSRSRTVRTRLLNLSRAVALNSSFARANSRLWRKDCFSDSTSMPSRGLLDGVRCTEGADGEASLPFFFAMEVILTNAVSADNRRLPFDPENVAILMRFLREVGSMPFGAA